jgi:hypothetical protein
VPHPPDPIDTRARPKRRAFPIQEIIMSFFTIETSYRLLFYRLRTYEADTIEGACELAIADEAWEDVKSDFETVGDGFVTGVWEGRDTAYTGRALTVPSQYGEAVERKADHFEVLLGLLKVFAHPPDAGLPDPPFWRERLDAAIAKANAILAGQPDPQAEG